MGLCWRSQASWATLDLLLHWCSSTLTVVGALHQLPLQLLHIPTPTHLHLSLTAYTSSLTTSYVFTYTALFSLMNALRALQSPAHMSSHILPCSVS